MNPVRLALLEDEVEWMCRSALVLAQRMESAPGTPAGHDVPVLAQGLASAALKVSHLLWRFGRRVTDRLYAAESEHLRARLGLTEASPLSPGRVSPLAELLTMDDEQLARAADGGTMTVVLQGTTYPLRPVIAAIRAVHAEVVCAAASPPPTLRLLR
jgi:hypothetical protein